MPLRETARGPIYYADHRTEDNPRLPVIFIHGAVETHLVWPGELRRLPESNAIVLDLPGRGRTPLPRRNAVSEYAQDVIALMDALSLSQAIILGHSMGGAIAQTLALDFPDRTAGLILMSTGAKLSVHSDILDGVFVDQDKVAHLLADWMWGENASPEARATTYHTIRTAPADLIHGDYAACNAFDVRKRLHEIHAPALVIAGTADRMVAYKYGQFLQQHIAGAELVSIEGAGHMVMLEDPQAVTQAVRLWLNATEF